MRYFALLITPIFFASCSLLPGGSETEWPNTYYGMDQSFRITLNENFVAVKSHVLSQNTMFAAADLANEKQDVTPNINVIKNDLGQNFPSYFFAKANIKKARNNIQSYEEINTEDISIDGKETILHTFMADNLWHMQAYLVYDQKSYIITATSYKDTPEDLQDTYRDIIQNFVYILDDQEQANTWETATEE